MNGAGQFAAKTEVEEQKQRVGLEEDEFHSILITDSLATSYIEPLSVSLWEYSRTSLQIQVLVIKDAFTNTDAAGILQLRPAWKGRG